MAKNYRSVQLARIHTLAKKLGFDTTDKDPQSDYRTALKSIADKRSSGNMTNSEREKVIGQFSEWAGETSTKNTPNSKPQGKQHNHPTSRKLIMLWVELKKLKKVEGNARLETWLDNQYGKKNPDWLTEQERNKAIEALKLWSNRKVKT